MRGVTYKRSVVKKTISHSWEKGEEGIFEANLYTYGKRSNFNYLIGRRNYCQVVIMTSTCMHVLGVYNNTCTTISEKPNNPLMVSTLSKTAHCL